MNLRNEAFIYPYLIILIGLAWLQIEMKQFDISVQVNNMHNIILDQICKFGTFIGDGFFSIICIIIIYRFNPTLAVCLLCGYLISAGLVQTLKHTLFNDYMRPMAPGSQLEISGIHLVDGVEMNYKNSFPSGHSTAAFALFTMASFFLKSNIKKIICLLLACFAAFTRVYLFQHFLIDAYIGSIIGFIIALTVYYLLIHCNGYELLKKKFAKK